MAERDPYPPLTLDSETSEQVARAAKRLGVSEEETIRRALAELLGKPEPVPPRPNLREWLAEYRRQHPLPPRSVCWLTRRFMTICPVDYSGAVRRRIGAGRDIG